MDPKEAATIVKALCPACRPLGKVLAVGGALGAMACPVCAAAAYIATKRAQGAGSSPAGGKGK